MKAERAILWLGVLTFAGFGVAFLVAFDPLARALGLRATPTARVDLQATYGGFELGFAAFLAFCATRRGWLRQGLVASGLAFAGFGLARAGSYVANPRAETWLVYLFLAEFAGAALSFWAARRTVGNR
jgi:hypothetical protein